MFEWSHFPACQHYFLCEHFDLKRNKIILLPVSQDMYALAHEQDSKYQPMFLTPPIQ